MANSVIGLDPVEPPTRHWEVYIGGEKVQQLASRYEEELGSDEWWQVLDTATRILSRCPDPSGPHERVTGLALGKVQSGKTLSYTALIALSVDNRYRITVVLVGTKNPLLEQNYDRLRRDLGTVRQNITVFKNPLPQEMDVVRSVLYGRGHALIVVLKHRTRINNVRMLLSSPDLRDYATLIIDDEGDEASLNTQFRRGGRSAVYNSILRLRDALPLHAYVAYTATPQANLLIDGIDGLSPNFGVLVDPADGYCGGSVFFGPNRDRYIRSVPASEGELVTSVPEGLKLAIVTFLVGAAIRHLTDETAWHSMLIHNSNRVTDHQCLQRAVRSLIDLWREALTLPPSDPSAAEVLTLARQAYDDLYTTVRNAPAWDDVRERLRQEIWLVEVWMVNSLPLGRDPISTPFRLRNNILIGGNMLGRGVTIEGLAVTYITRRARNETNADTMEQRTRWFGYKEDYLDLCRIFLTPQLREDYTELLRHEDDFWDALRRNERQGLSIRDWPRMLRLDMSIGLRPTRTNVANYRQFRSGGWDIQNLVATNRDTAVHNIRVVNDFFQHHSGESHRYGSTEHTMVRNCRTEMVISDLLAHLNTDGTDWENAYNIEYLARLLLGGCLSTIDVLLMSKGEFRNRSHEGGRIVNLMQGRTPGKQPTDPDFYPGDREIHENRVQLQVHLVRLRASGRTGPIESTALALYIPPNDPRYDLHYVIRDDGQ